MDTDVYRVAAMTSNYVKAHKALLKAFDAFQNAKAVAEANGFTGTADLDLHDSFREIASDRQKMLLQAEKEVRALEEHKTELHNSLCVKEGWIKAFVEHFDLAPVPGVPNTARALAHIGRKMMATQALREVTPDLDLKKAKEIVDRL